MNKLIILFFVLFSTVIFGQMTFRSFKSVRIDCASTNIPTSFSATNPASRVLSELSNYSHVMLIHDTNCKLMMNTNYGTVAPPDDNESNVYIWESSKMLGIVADGVSIGGAVYLRSQTTPCTSGIVTVVVW